MIRRSVNIDPDIGELLTIPDVMAALKVSRSSVFRLLKDRKLESLLVLKQLRITERSLKAFVHNNIDRETQPDEGNH